MFEILRHLFKERKLIDKDDRILMRDVKKCLYSSYFLQNCDYYLAGRETLINIKLILTGIYILERKFLTPEVIKSALTAYELECRTKKQ